MSNQRDPVIGEIFLQRGFHVPQGPVQQRIAWARADVRTDAWCVVVGFTASQDDKDEVLFTTRSSNPGTPLRAAVETFLKNWERP